MLGKGPRIRNSLLREKLSYVLFKMRGPGFEGEDCEMITFHDSRCEKCPFCQGLHAVSISFRHEGEKLWQIKCGRCFASGMSCETETLAVKAWTHTSEGIEVLSYIKRKAEDWLGY